MVNETPWQNQDVNVERTQAPSYSQEQYQDAGATRAPASGRSQAYMDALKQRNMGTGDRGPNIGKDEPSDGMNGSTRRASQYQNGETTGQANGDLNPDDILRISNYPKSAKDLLVAPQLRIDTIKGLIDYYLTFFKKYVKVENSYVNKIKRMNKSTNPVDVTRKKFRRKGSGNRDAEDAIIQGEGTGVPYITEKFRTFQTRMLNVHEEKIDDIKKNIIPDLKRLRRQVSKYETKFIKVISKEYGAMSSQGKQIDKGINKLRNQVVDKSVNTKKQDDPILHRNELEKNLKKQEETEEKFQKTLNVELEKIHEWESKVVRKISDLIDSYFTIKTNECKNLEVVIAENREELKNFNYQDEWAKFQNHIHNGVTDYSDTTRRHSTEIRRLSDKNIDVLSVVAEGPIKMKSGLLKSMHDFYGVMTVSKYLHLYKNQKEYEDKSDPVHSFYLPTTEIYVNQTDGKFVLSHKRALLPKKKHSFTESAFHPKMHDGVLQAGERGSGSGTGNKPWYDILESTINSDYNKPSPVDEFIRRNSTVASQSSQIQAPPQEQAQYQDQYQARYQAQPEPEKRFVEEKRPMQETSESAIKEEEPENRFAQETSESNIKEDEPENRFAHDIRESNVEDDPEKSETAESSEYEQAPTFSSHHFHMELEDPFREAH
ncbi:hypothetical protein AX774_g4198 [Zancudomyces culisetae]|uniref:Uncharacterized protein n=1 Tax=Zancudomyces culisetae TaxID=1213189 RepID=A0A1R1PMY1_ZANCU|nr:hypothetical protein AX774_g4198 [Zancudomyces culisetae]|eukprot:OMH82325.1 hypothetical protein AX774_g4198 [Zancudomyces culisetae]